MAIEIDDNGLEGFGGVTAGAQTEERWQYPGIGYNATNGIFYIGEEEAKTLDFIPFAMRQCKEVVDADGVTRRFPIKTRRADMPEGDVKTRLQVVGLVNGELHIFGARSWTARAAWANPLGGPYHDDRFEGGLWNRLAAHIKEVKAQKGIATAPLCYRLSLAVGQEMDLSAAGNARQKAKSYPITATAVTFVGAEQAAANSRLYAEEALDEWVAEWSRAAVGEATADHAPAVKVVEDELFPF